VSRRRALPRFAAGISLHAAPQAGDEAVGDWPRERLLAMDRRFRERVERALKMGDENRQAAAATYDANPARGALEVA
jgi:hypothetical protein